MGKAAGAKRSMKGGVGVGRAAAGDVVVGAVAVVNAMGDVRDARGEIIAGARNDAGGFLDSARLIATGGVDAPDKARALLGYNPATAYTEGVRKFVEWLKR